MSWIRKFEFRLGSTYLSLEVPPFYVNFEKRSFGSIMERRRLPREGMVIYVYVSRHRHVEKLLLLKKLHQDIRLPEDLNDAWAAIEELSRAEYAAFVDFLKIGEFVTSVKRLEEEWQYGGNGIWQKRLGPFMIYMILLMGYGRWTVRPAISKENMRGYGVEIPVDTGLREDFMRVLEEGELDEIHDHVENQHFHLTVGSLERFIDMAQRWDYYFSTRTRWRQTVFMSADEP